MIRTPDSHSPNLHRFKPSFPMVSFAPTRHQLRHQRAKAESARLTAEHAELKTAQFRSAHYRPFAPIAWTGGNSPAKPSETPVWVRAYARALFRRQVNDWRKFWADSPDWYTLRTFYRRAAADAHATFRDSRNG